MAGRGRFITFEGGEGAGKSTQIRLLADRLRTDHGLDPLVTREPGGTPGAEAIRDLLVSGAADRWDALSECLLVFAARHDHVRRVIGPALEVGRWVLCDRFVDSTMAYQGIAGGLGREAVEQLSALTLGDLAPDLTLILDQPVSVGLARTQGRSGDEARYEERELSFHETIRKSFLQIAASAPRRCRVIDTSQSDIKAVSERINSLIEELFIEHGYE